MSKRTNYYGSVSLDGIKDALTKNPDKRTTHEKYGDQLKVDAVLWEDGNISVSVYNKDTKERFNVANLRLSQYQQDGEQPVTSSEPATADLPF